MIADKYREKTAGMTTGEQAITYMTEGELEFFHFAYDTRSEVADLIEAVEEFVKPHSAILRDKETGEGAVILCKCPSCVALTALREKMEELG